MDVRLGHKEVWVMNNWCLWTVVLEKTFVSPLDSKEVKPVNPKENQSWIFIRETDAEAEAPILWPPDGKNWLIGKDPDVGKDRRQEKKRTTEDEMVGWHHRLNGHEFEQTLGDGEGQGSLEYCSPWGYKESDSTEQLNNKTQDWLEARQWWCWPFLAFMTVVCTLLAFVPILCWILLYSSPFMNMHTLPKSLHEYACTPSLKLPKFCCRGDTALGKVPLVPLCCKY